MTRICPECGRKFDTEVARCPADGTPTVLYNPQDELIGRTIDERFTLKALLGTGGMGSVYRAYQHSMDRDVALKLVRRELATDENAIKRFFREARAASRLTGPHVISVYDFGQTPDGMLYIVMEHLKGKPLSRILRENPGPMEPQRAVRIALQVLEALGEAHGVGVLHRDLKPDNIFLTDAEEGDYVKVLDFGIAKILGGSGGLTSAGAVFGTPTYMSPEQAQGHEVDARSDLYSVGVILFELLAGKPPFEAETPLALVYKKLHQPCPTVSQVNPEVRIPPALDEVLAQMLATGAADRPQNAREARRILAQAVGAPSTAGMAAITEGVPEKADPDARPEVSINPTPAYEAPAVGLSRRKKPVGLWVGSGVLGFLVGAVVVVALVGPGKLTKATPRGFQSTPVQVPVPPPAPAPSPAPVPAPEAQPAAAAPVPAPVEAVAAPVPGTPATQPAVEAPVPAAEKPAAEKPAAEKPAVEKPAPAKVAAPAPAEKAAPKAPKTPKPAPEGKPKKGGDSDDDLLKMMRRGNL